MFTHQIGVVESCKIIVFFLDNPRSIITFCSRRLPLISCHPFRPAWAVGTENTTCCMGVCKVGVHPNKHSNHSQVPKVGTSFVFIHVPRGCEAAHVIARLAHQNAGSMWCYDAPEPIRAPGYPL
ncbi:hypothetical protein GQ55_4G216900 [Panicum hallii var. hallii]|uniref:Uncharacterized protein n=1 Tax=Panicum hallii var. hallii TaxID=1504633 RepID=A0A2T7DZB8_9POAL|nr:hypothetical protein GQ55_4G216900 [Panicum hallii var. hallii]